MAREGSDDLRAIARDRVTDRVECGQVGCVGVGDRPVGGVGDGPAPQKAPRTERSNTSRGYSSGSE